jgi:hypothetical protein
MKKVLLILFLVTVLFSNAQNKFNKIVYDEMSNIALSVLELDTGYVVLSGTLNEYDVRSFAINYIDLEGNKKWRKVYGDSNILYWEGNSDCMKKSNNIFYTTGRAEDYISNKESAYIYIYDSLLNVKHLKYPLAISTDTSGIKILNIIRHSDKSFYISGQILEQTSSSYSKLLLLKTDSTGNYLWHKSLGSKRDQWGTKIIQTSDNNLLMKGGMTKNKADMDWYLMKADTSGNIIWERSFGHYNHYDMGRSNIDGLIETKDSCYIACGWYPTAGHLNWIDDYFREGCLRKVDKDGNLVWEKFYRNYSYYPASENEQEMKFIKSWINAIIQLEDGDIIALGGMWAIAAMERGFMMRTDKDGNIKWHRDYYAEVEHSSNQYLVNVKQTIDKGFVMAGYGNSYDLIGYDPPQQMWLIKTDSLGIDGLSNTNTDALNIDMVFPETLYVDTVVDVMTYISGKSAPYKIEISTGQEIDSIFYPPKYVPVEIGLGYVYAKFGPYISYEETITEATLKNHEWGKCIAKPIKFEVPKSSGHHNIEITITDAYGETKTINKEIHVREIGILSEYADEGISLYPNPAKDVLNINFTHQHEYKTAVICDISGRELQSIPLHKDKNIINISSLPKGSYIVTIKTDKGNFDKLIVKE